MLPNAIEINGLRRDEILMHSINSAIQALVVDAAS